MKYSPHGENPDPSPISKLQFKRNKKFLMMIPEPGVTRSRKPNKSSSCGVVERIDLENAATIHAGVCQVRFNEHLQELFYKRTNHKIRISSEWLTISVT